MHLAFMIVELYGELPFQQFNAYRQTVHFRIYGIELWTARKNSTFVRHFSIDNFRKLLIIPQTCASKQMDFRSKNSFAFLSCNVPIEFLFQTRSKEAFTLIEKKNAPKHRQRNSKFWFSSRWMLNDKDLLLLSSLFKGFTGIFICHIYYPLILWIKRIPFEILIKTTHSLRLIGSLEVKPMICMHWVLYSKCDWISIEPLNLNGFRVRTKWKANMNRHKNQIAKCIERMYVYVRGLYYRSPAANSRRKKWNKTNARLKCRMRKNEQIFAEMNCHECESNEHNIRKHRELKERVYGGIEWSLCIISSGLVASKLPSRYTT